MGGRGVPSGGLFVAAVESGEIYSNFSVALRATETLSENIRRSKKLFSLDVIAGQKIRNLKNQN